MKKYTLSVGLLVFMLTLGGMAYGQGKDSSAGLSGTGQSSDWNNEGSDQGMGGTSGSTGSNGMDMSSGRMQVNINSASAKELQAVPGISRSIANNIVKYRDQNGPFTSVDELVKEKGINQQKLDAIHSNITVGTGGFQKQQQQQ